MPLFHQALLLMMPQSTARFSCPSPKCGEDIMHMSLLSQRTLFPGDDSKSHISSKPEYRLMNALGSNSNDADLYYLEKEVNEMKHRVGHPGHQNQTRQHMDQHDLTSLWIPHLKRHPAMLCGNCKLPGIPTGPFLSSEDKQQNLLTVVFCGVDNPAMV